MRSPVWRRATSGDFVGEMNVLDGEPRSATIVATRPLFRSSSSIAPTSFPLLATAGRGPRPGQADL